MSLIASINPPNQIQISGFEAADEAGHMIAWLGRGGDFRQFVTKDIESELYRQTPGAQLLSVVCTTKPDVATTAKQERAGHPATVTDLSVTFPIMLRVRTATGEVWKLNVEYNYEATSLHDGRRRRLSQNFKIVSHEREL